MTRLRCVAAGLVGLLALGVLLAGGASASIYNLKMLPEIGRCIDRGVGRGEYRGGKCTRSEPVTGSRSWFSGPGAKNKFTASASSLSFETPAAPHDAVACNKATGEGEYTGPKNLAITSLVLTGCRTAEGACEKGVGSTIGEITAESLDGELGFILRRKKKVGWDLKPASGSKIASFECGAQEAGGLSLGGGVPRELQGSVIARILPIDRMFFSFALTAEAKKGVQFPQSFEGGAKDTLSMVVGEKLPGTGKAQFAATLTAHPVLKNEEPLEALAACTGTAC